MMKLERMDDFFAARIDGYDAHMKRDIERQIEKLRRTAQRRRWLKRLVALMSAFVVLLTMFAGLIPSRYAAKRDPVEALRTE